jgi:hypothetical protein
MTYGKKAFNPGKQLQGKKALPEKYCKSLKASRSLVNNSLPGYDAGTCCGRAEQKD